MMTNIPATVRQINAYQFNNITILVLPYLMYFTFSKETSAIYIETIVASVLMHILSMFQ
jgi:hypothetical protein